MGGGREPARGPLPPPSQLLLDKLHWLNHVKSGKGKGPLRAFPFPDFTNDLTCNLSVGRGKQPEGASPYQHINYSLILSVGGHWGLGGDM